MNLINKHTWNDVKEKVKQANPSIYEVVEEIQISPDIPFFLAHYDFGEHFGHKDNAYLPTKSGQLEKIDSQYTDNDLFRHLGYGKHSLPLGLILDKYCEWHFIGENRRIFPDYVQGPGAIFNTHIIFDDDRTIDNNVLSVSSGALSTFLLPNIGCQKKHLKLQKSFNISNIAPKTPYDHYQVFQALIKSNKTSWQSKILYFSEQFINEVKYNNDWIKLKLYFSESLRKKLALYASHASCNDLFLSANGINRYRPPPFIIDTAKYIFNICLGSGIGVKPATDETYFPVKDIQRIYKECYGLEYTPTVMVPATLANYDDSVYYPLQCPFAKINTFKTNQSNSTFTELEMLKNVLLTYQAEFTEKNSAAFGSPLYYISKETEFSFYHYQAEGNNDIKNSSILEMIDTRFSFSNIKEKSIFPGDAKLFRGCVRLSR